MKDLFEEQLFARRRDLFSSLDLVFFDTTSVYFEGAGGMDWGRYGHTKDHRPDRKQMVIGAVLDGEGRPLCCELWPGNVTDVKTLIPVVERLRTRFRINSICIVADRGMISRETIEQLQSPERKVHFILGARLKSVKEIYETVLSRGGRYHEVHGRRTNSADPSPLKVKDVNGETTPIRGAGGVSVLHILVDFPDLADWPMGIQGWRIEPEAAEAFFIDVGAFMRNASWGQFWFETVNAAFDYDENADRRPLRMPNETSFYKDLEKDKRYDGWFRLRDHAITAASSAGYDVDNYWSYSVTFSQIDQWLPTVGRGILNDPGIWLNGRGDSPALAAHEFGHNLGAGHSGWWNVGELDGDDPLDPGGTYVEYGDYFDVMGDRSTQWAKKALSWGNFGKLVTRTR